MLSTDQKESFSSNYLDCYMGSLGDGDVGPPNSLQLKRMSQCDVIPWSNNRFAGR
jgi:hypothetical protein